jgi:hypothetical protein
MMKIITVITNNDINEKREASWREPSRSEELYSEVCN